MASLIHRLRIRLASFGRDNHAVAAVEFALIAPFLIALYFGSLEAASLFTVDRKVETVAGTMGDLVAQWDGKISAATVADYFKAAKNIMSPYAASNLTQTVSCISVAADGTTKVVWSKDANGAVPYAKDAPFTLPPSTKSLALGSFLIVSEATYANYVPVLGVVFKVPFTLVHRGYYAPRFGGTIDLT